MKVIIKNKEIEPMIQRPRLETLVLLTSTPAHTRYLHQAIESHRKIGVQLAIGWDYYNFNYPKPISDDIIIFCSQNFFGVQNGEAWQIETALSYAIHAGYRFLLKSAGDLVIHNPEGLQILINNCQEHDLISRTAHEVDTKFFFGKVPSLYRIATNARADGPMQIIETQYFHQVQKFGFKMKHSNLYQPMGVQHLQPNHEPSDWWNGTILNKNEWRK